MKAKERTIGAGHSCILVKDKSLLSGWGSPVYKWLYDHGFISWGVKGIYPGVDWVFVNIYSKVFAPGLRGYAVTSVVCDHAVTFEEFETIYNIYKKYEKLDTLNMSKEEQDAHEKKWTKIRDEQKKYVTELTYEKFFDEVKEKLAPELKPWCKTEEEVINYMKKEEKVIKEAYEKNKRMFTDKQKEWDNVRYPSSVAECLGLMYE